MKTGMPVLPAPHYVKKNRAAGTNPKGPARLISSILEISDGSMAYFALPPCDTGLSKNLSMISRILEAQNTKSGLFKLTI